MDTIRVLVFPCGSEIAMEYHKALKDVRYIELWGASSVSDHGEYAYRNYISDAPFVTDPAFGEWLKGIVAEKRIDVVCPAMDSVIPILAKLAPELGCRALVPSSRTAEICRDKVLTYETFARDWFNPGFWTSPDDVPAFPVALKPAEGQGSQGFKVVNSEGELREELQRRPDRQVVCEYLPGDEYTVDCFTDRHGNLIFANQRRRARTKAGISVRSCNVQLEDSVREIASSVSERLGMRGVWFFQVKRNAAGEFRLLEIAPRVAGTMCLERALGVNLPALAVLDALDNDVKVEPLACDVTVDRAFENDFRLGLEYGAVYMDFDDTLVCDGEVNLEAVRFLYQCCNVGIPVFLLTRHETDARQALRDARIDEGLFADVIWLARDGRKSEYVDASLRPIFIDDSFSERADVHAALGIPTFGPESIEVLIDRRQ